SLHGEWTVADAVSFTPISAQPIDETPADVAPASATAFQPISAQPIEETAPAKIHLGAHPGSGFQPPTFGLQGVADAALTLGSGTLKAVTGAVNDLLPEWVGGEGSRAALADKINRDPVFNYQPQTAEGQAIMHGLGTVTAPIGWALGKAKEGIANVAGARA